MMRRLGALFTARVTEYSVLHGTFGWLIERLKK
jgi:hypothetical protein